jgi:tRNA G18 (ribose-2'-O)-methylase SpoU
VSRGFFGVGCEDISKPGNVGALMRSAHAFGASFFFFIKPHVDMAGIRQSDTSAASGHMPLYVHDSIAELQLPRHCRLVGVELTDDAVNLPSFRHPLQAAYILGPEKGSLSPEVQARCDHIVKIPTRFCINVGVAGAIVMYDRMISLGAQAERPVRAG